MTLTLLLQLTDEEQLYATIEPQPAAIEADQPAAEPVPAIEVLVAAEDGMA